MSPNLTIQSNSDISQVQLNSENKRTLVVVPINDPASHEIERISRLSGAKTMPVYAPSGLTLSEEMVNAIAQRAESEGIKRVILVELPPLF